ncbi:MAG: DHH family phosphoesterase [Flavobacteriales bacterium]
MGSSLALYNLLVKLDHEVNVITPNDYASFLHWLPGNNLVTEYESSRETAEKLVDNADIIFMLDFNHIYRIDGLASNVESSNALKVLIDHHQDPQENIADLIFLNLLFVQLHNFFFK